MKPLPFRLLPRLNSVFVLLGALVLVALPPSRAQAQYATFAQRQQAIINGTTSNYTVALNSPDFAGAEAFFYNGQPTQGNAIVAGAIANLQANPTNWAGDLQAMISGMDCYYRYGNQWTTANQTNFQSFYTTFQGYSGETTSNLTLLAATSRYLGGQAWGEAAYQTTGTYVVYSTSDPTGYNLLTSRIPAQAQTGVGEFASRPYGFYDTYPVLVLAQWCANSTLKNQAYISYELALAQASGSWLQGAWPICTGRSYPDLLNQQPWGGAELMWLYLGGMPPSIGVNNESLPAAIAGYSIAESGTITGTLTVPGYTPPAAIIQAATHTGTYTAQSAFNANFSQFQSTYITPNYAVFSEGVSPGVSTFDQVYPNGVMWLDSNTSHADFLWITDPAEDTPSGVSGFHTHGINGSAVHWTQSKGTFVMVRTVTTGTADPYPYFLGYVPGSYQAAINDAANGRIYLYYNNEVMIAISSFAPFTWDPQGGIYAPSSTPYSGDSQFHIPAITAGNQDQACCALEVANPTDYPGSTPAAQLAAFQAALQNMPLPKLTTGATPMVSYTDHTNQTLQATFYGGSGVNGVAYPGTYSLNGVPHDYSSWPQIYNPNVVQAYGGNVITALGNQETLYDLTNWTITTSTVTTPAAPTGLAAVRGNTSAQLSWTASPTAMTYVVQRSTSPTGSFTVVQNTVVPTQVNDYGLTNYLTYYYEVAAVNNVGTSTFTAPVAVTPTQTGLLGTYWSNTTGTGTPNTTELDPNVYYYWTTGFGNGLNEPNFYAQWTGSIVAPTSDTYTFTLNSQNGSELKINGSVIINHLGNHPQSQASGTFTMVAGQSYPVVITYSDGQVCQLSWACSTIATEPVPNSAFTPAITAAPATVTAQAANHAVALSWTASPIATNYNVKRSTTNGSGYVTIASPTGTSFIDTTAVNGTPYYYVVSAVDGGGESANSTPAASATPAAGIAAIPSGLTATASSGTVSLTWNAVAGATSYNIYRSLTSGSGYTLLNNSSSPGYIDGTVSNGTAYYYVVTSVNGSGESAYSTQAGTTPQPAVAQVPTNLAATVAINQVALSWTAASGATSYNVYRSTTSDSNFALLGSSTTATFTDNTAVGGTPYYYVVTGVNSAGESNNSLQVSATPLPPIPAAPTQLTATGTTNEVKLTWPLSSYATSYDIYRSLTSGSGYVSTGTATTGSFTDTTGTNGTPYYYVVTAVDTTGTSGYSPEAPATPLPAIASAPTGLIGSAGNGLVGLSWGAATGATSYKIYRSTTSGSGYVLVGTSSIPNFTDFTAVNGTPYYYVVTSVNLGGESGDSTQISATAQVSTSVLPSPWVDQDINTAVAGSATYTSGTFTVKGAGVGIYYATDGFNFVYRPLVSDGVLVARVRSGGNSAKTGIIMRQSLTANSTYVIDAFNGGPDAVKTEYRATAGGSASSASNTPANDVTETSFPYWLELVRTGNVFTAYRSPDGVNWTQNGGAVTNTLSDPIYVGLAQSSDSSGSVTTATFDSATMLASPTNLTAPSVLATKVNLAWQINPGSVVSDATAAQVEVSPSGANTWTVLTSTLTPGTSTYTASNLSPSTAYDFRVNTTGNGISTPFATLSDVLTVPAAPTSLAATQVGGAVSLTWSPSTGATGYNVKRGSMTGGPYTTIGTATTGSYSDANVTAGNSYFYVVTATNAGGESLNSNEASLSVLSGFQQWLAANNLPTSTTATATPDNDGVSVLLKYATNLTPGTPSAAGPAAVSANGDFLSLQFTRVSPAPVNYLVESSPDLVNWSALASLAAGTSSWTGSATVVETGTGPVAVAVTDTASLSGGTAPRFLRLRVTSTSGATEPGTVPMGDVPVTLAAGATSSTSLPLDNAPLARNAVTAVATSTLTVVNAGSYANAATPCALRLLSGNGAGRTFTITAQSGNALGLATAGVDLTQFVAVGDRYEILPLDTLSSFFGTTNSLLATGPGPTVSDNVLLWGGTNWITYYNNGTNWKQAGSLLLLNNTVLSTNYGIMIIRRGATPVKYQVIGRVPEVALSQFTTPGATTFLGCPYPLSRTLGNTPFAGSTGWLAGPGPTTADIILAWNGTNWVTYYFNGTTWRQGGSLLNQTNTTFAPGQPLVIQRLSTPAALNAFIAQPLPYTP